MAQAAADLVAREREILVLREQGADARTVTTKETARQVSSGGANKGTLLDGCGCCLQGLCRCGVRCGDANKRGGYSWMLPQQQVSTGDNM
jgi:hypothetical protein